MAKKKSASKKKKTYSDIFKDFGGVITGDGITKNYSYKIPFRHKGLNKITCSVPSGCLCEISGHSAIAKSFLLYELGAECTKMGGHFLLVDAENAYDASYGAKVGLKESPQFAISKVRVIEDLFPLMRNYVYYVRKQLKSDKPIVIGVDSYTQLKIKEFIEALEDDGDPSGYGHMRKNVVFGPLLEEFIDVLDKYNVVLIFINQLTKVNSKIPGFPPKIQSYAEDKFQFFSTLRIRGTLGKSNGTSKKIVKKVNSLTNQKDGIKKQIGIWATWETIKNRCAKPFQKTETRIIYSSGLKEYSGLAELLINEGKLKIGTRKAVNAKGEELKTPNMGFKITGNKDEFFEVCKNVANPPSKIIEDVTKDIIKKYPEFLEPDNSFDEDSEEEE